MKTIRSNGEDFTLTLDDYSCATFVVKVTTDEESVARKIIY
ncbi:MAG: hypothetical protein ACLS4S_05055 [Bacteroides nordii]